MPQHLRTMLLEALALGDVDLYEIDGMLGTSDLWSIVNLDRPDLHDAAVHAGDSEAAGRRRPTSSRRFAKAICSCTTPTSRSIRSCSSSRPRPADPNVLAIKQTLYRTSGNSPVVAALVEAAENGKQVAALDRTQSALRRREQHPLGAQPRARRRARRLRLPRHEGARQGDPGRAQRARGYPALRSLRHRQLQRQDGQDLYRSLALHVPSRARRRRHASLQPADRLLEGDPLLEALGRADDAALGLRRADRARSRARPRRPPLGIVAKLNAISDARMVQSLYAPRKPACRSS
jgi:hypothetical protein